MIVDGVEPYLIWIQRLLLETIFLGNIGGYIELCTDFHTYFLWGFIFAVCHKWSDILCIFLLHIIDKILLPLTVYLKPHLLEFMFKCSCQDINYTRCNGLPCQMGLSLNLNVCTMVLDPPLVVHSTIDLWNSLVQW